MLKTQAVLNKDDQNTQESKYLKNHAYSNSAIIIKIKAMVKNHN